MPRSSAPTFSEVLRVTGRPETRSYAVDRFREQGILPASGMQLTKPWAGCRSAVADALTATEDWLELTHPKWAERDVIRDVRRQLEGAS